MIAPLASLPGTESWLLAGNDTSYQLSVALPYTYRAETARRYPVLYLLDSNLYFGLLTDLTRSLARCGAFPDVLVVGIGYPVDNDIAVARQQINVHRARDLTPISHPPNEAFLSGVYGVPSLRTGGAPAFRAFLRDSLMPHIEARYRVGDHRVLIGHSFGGLFALHALFQQPDLFAGYIVGSPSLFFGDEVLFREEAAYAQAHTDLSARLFVGIGGDEETSQYPMLSTLERFLAQLDSRRYPSLALTRQITPGDDHCGAALPTFYAGLKALFV